MALEQRLHECTCQQARGESSLPKEGARVRVTLRKDVLAWEGKERITIPAGTIYEGTATAVDTEGFFDVVDDDDKHNKFYLHDSSLHIEVIALVQPI